MKEDEKKLIHDAIEQIKKCNERGDTACMLVLLKLCKYIAGDKFVIRLEVETRE